MPTLLEDSLVPPQESTSRNVQIRLPSIAPTWVFPARLEMISPQSTLKPSPVLSILHGQV